jgi:hypothetical protein
MIFYDKEYVKKQVEIVKSWRSFLVRGFAGLCRVFKDFLVGLQARELPALIDEEREPITRIDRPEKWPKFEGGLDKIPKGLKERDEVYGKPVLSVGADNRFKVDRNFARQLGLVGSENFSNYNRRIYMHNKVAPYFVEAMRRAYEVCPEWRPKRIGCFNPRRMRHSKNPRVPFSDHTYAIAFDIDPSENRAWSRKKYKDRPRPLEKGWEKYSNIPEGVVLAFESVGFDAGMRWKTFCDPMHFSLRKLGK